MMMSNQLEQLSDLKLNDAGLIPAVIQSAVSKRVLMVAWMNKEAISETISSGQTVFFSRSRQELWIKGQTSGNGQKVLAIEIDCDKDCLLIQVAEEGPACHTGTNSCFDSHARIEMGE
jgi:phosphoribosyl-AMP cyclohydrolase